MKKPKFFQCYLDNDTILAHLTDEQAGRLWKSLFLYANHDEKVKSDDPMVSLAFDVMVQQIDRDFSKYTDKCEKNKKNRNINNDRQRPSTTVNDGDQEEDKDEDKEEDKEDNKDNNEEDNKDNNKEDNEEIIEQAVGCDPTVYEITHEVIDYLNSKIGSAYKHSTKTTIQLIKARLNEGYTVDDIKKVIDNRVQAWGKDKKMAQYLRPQTLFSTKFEGYLNSTCAEPPDYTQVFDYDEEF